MGKASDWLREERRKVLGDWVAVCLRCGAARRWFEAHEDEVPDECPQCGGELLRRCKSCGAAFSSIAAVECEECGEPLRPNELFGAKIRRARHDHAPNLAGAPKALTPEQEGSGAERLRGI